jgi:hypothetical protein
MPAFVNQAMLLPWLFAAATLAWDRAAGPLLPVGAVGLVVGGLLLSGQPQIAALALLGLGIAHLVGGLQARQPRAALAGWSRLGAGVLLGCGIGAIQLLLLRDVVTYAFTLHQEGGYAEPRIAALTFTVALWPYLLGQVMEPWDPALYPSRLNWEALPLTVGGAQLLLVLAGLLVALDRRARPAVPFGRVLPYVVVLALFYGIVAGSSAGIPGLWGWGPLGRINFPRYGAPVTALMLAVLAGWAVAAAGAVRRRHLIGANVGLALLALLAAWAVAPAFLAPSDRVDPAYRAWSVPLGLAPFALGAAGANLALGLLLAGRTTLGRAQVALVVCLGAELASFLRYGLPLEREAARLGVPGLLVAGAVLVLAGRARAAGVAAALALGLQAVVVAASPARLAAVFDPFAFEPPHITFLRERLGPGSAGGRILGTVLHVQSNASSAFGVAELTGLQPVQAEGTSIYVREVLGDRHVSFVTPVGWGGMAPEGTDPFAWPSYPAHRAAYNAIAVRYLVAPPGGWLAQHRPEGVEPVYADGAAVVYEDVLALPRAFTVDRAAPAAGITDAVRQLRAPGADPRRRVVVEAPPDALPEALRRDGDADVRPATILRHAPEAVDVLVEAEGPRLLVLADAAYPRWSAAIDGAPARILRVNAAVRGVVVPPGRHVVEFRYAQLRADLALAASLACGAGAPVLVALGLARRRGRIAR